MAPERTEQKMRRANQCSFGKAEAETKERGKRKLLRHFATEDGNSNSARYLQVCDAPQNCRTPQRTAFRPQANQRRQDRLDQMTADQVTLLLHGNSSAEGGRRLRNLWFDTTGR